jgi:isocitrate/isopropylmalate dehydrogenase
VKKHAREALKVGRRVAQALGFDVVLLREQTSGSHYRFAVLRADGTELGRFTLSESPRIADCSASRARQSVQRLLRERA